jgi:gluconolactonase
VSRHPLRAVLGRALATALLLAGAAPALAAQSIERLDPALDALVAPDATVETLARGLAWAEGPVWRRDARGGDGGYLLLSDAPHNTIWKWRDGEGLTVFLRPAGYTRDDPPGREMGSNGLTLDARGRLVMADHGNRQIARLDDSTFTKTTLAARYRGKRLNSPNDLVFRSNGDLFFTDPPYGLRGLDRDPARELTMNGVYRLAPDGTLTLLTGALTYPNGIALSPDERTLYVAVSDGARPVVMAYALAADGGISDGRVLFDATPLLKTGRRGAPDGIKVDRAGHLFVAAADGVVVLAPDGKHLGSIRTGRQTANCAFGDDGSTLYLTANDRLMRVRLRTRGAGF